MQQRKIKIIISGGGTGGHIFPAIAIANKLKEKVEGIDILFVGAIGKMEMEKVPIAGYKIEGLPIAGLQRKLTLKNLSFPFKVMKSLSKAKSIVKGFNPDVVVGVGGYASGPTLRVAAKLGIPTVLQEQNSYPGITNKILAKKADKICVAYDGMDKFFPKDKIFLTGNPVRSEVVKLEGKKQQAADFFKLDQNKPILLIVGGSLGARTINESIHSNLAKFREAGLQVIWQTGKYYYEKAKEAVNKYETDGINAFDFITKMDLAYAAADFVVSRAGAIAISELCLVKKPCIFVPSPNVAEDHQTKNAMALVNNNAAILVKDIEAREILGDEVIKLALDKELQEKLSINIAQLGHARATEKIADIVLGLVK